MRLQPYTLYLCAIVRTMQWIYSTLFQIWNETENSTISIPYRQIEPADGILFKWAEKSIAMKSSLPYCRWVLKLKKIRGKWNRGSTSMYFGCIAPRRVMIGIHLVFRIDNRSQATNCLLVVPGIARTASSCCASANVRCLQLMLHEHFCHAPDKKIVPRGCNIVALYMALGARTRGKFDCNFLFIAPLTLHCLCLQSLPSRVDF